MRQYPSHIHHITSHHITSHHIMKRERERGMQPIAGSSRHLVRLHPHDRVTQMQTIHPKKTQKAIASTCICSPNPLCTIHNPCTSPTSMPISTSPGICPHLFTHGAGHQLDPSAVCSLLVGRGCRVAVVWLSCGCRVAGTC